MKEFAHLIEIIYNDIKPRCLSYKLTTFNLYLIGAKSMDKLRTSKMTIKFSCNMTKE